MMIAYLPLLICIIGLVLFKLVPAWSRVGEHMFWTGLLVTLMSVMNKTVHLF